MPETQIKPQQQLALFDRIAREFRVNSGVLRDHINKLLNFTPTFAINVLKQGTIRNLCLEGTLPVDYKGKRYSYPCRIVILDDYPTKQPVCLFIPVQGLEIAKNHKHVDSKGLCYLPYLAEWTKKSTLVGLVTQMTQVFSESPPMFALQPKPPQTASLTTSKNTPQPQPQPQPKTQTQIQTQPQPQPQPQPSQNPKILKINMINENTQQKYQQLLEETTSQLQILTITATEHPQSINEEIQNVDEQIAVLEKKIVEAVLKISEEEQEQFKSYDVDIVTTPREPKENQKLSLQAEILAQDDVLYKFQSFLTAGLLDFDTYLKSVRNTSRDQFFKVALLNKVERVL